MPSLKLHNYSNPMMEVSIAAFSNRLYRINRPFPMKFDSKVSKISLSTDAYRLSIINEDCEAASHQGSIPTEQFNGTVPDLPDHVNSQLSLSIQFSEANESYYRNYETKWNTPYMIHVFATKANENSSDFSISEYLPRELQEESSAKSCKCCLCKHRTKSNVSYKGCIETSSYGKPCTRGMPQKRSIQLKYQQRSICEDCIDLLILLNTKKIKKTINTKNAARFSCCFDSCKNKKEEFTKATIKKHFLCHLDVKLYLCSICDKDFNNKIQLRKHEKSH